MWRVSDNICLTRIVEPCGTILSQRPKMLKEIHGVADDPPARRRWFHDEYFDLFVWQTGDPVTLLQLCYGVDFRDRALVWDRRGGFFPAGPPAPDDVVGRVLAAADALRAAR